MIRAACVAALVALVAGCSGGSSGAVEPGGPVLVLPNQPGGHTGASRPSGPVEDPNLLTEMEEWAERACACEDYACFVAEMDLANNLRSLRIDWWSDDQKKRGVAARTRASDCGFDRFAADAGWPDAARAAYRDAILARDLELLRGIYEAARMYWLDHDRSAATPSAGPTPALGTCCGYADGVCPADDSVWASDPWRSINAEIGDAHRFSFEYEVAKKDTGFTVRAYGDLDCDGEYSTYELRSGSNKSAPTAFPKWRVKAAGE